MKYKVKLLYGAFFFSGPVSINGNGKETEIDESDLTPELSKALSAARTNGVIETDIPEYVEETFRTDVLIQDNGAETVAEPATEEVAEEESAEEAEVSEPEETEEQEPATRKRRTRKPR